MESFVRISICTGITLAIFTNCSGQTLSDADALMSRNLNNYDRRHRPVLNQSSPVTVNATFTLYSFFEFEEVVGKLVLSANYRLAWWEERMPWLPADFGGITSQSYALDSVWYPEIVMANAYDDLADYMKDWNKIRIHANGLAEVIPSALMKLKCSVDVTYYPFDTQVCSVNIIPYSYYSTEVLLQVERDVVDTSWYIEHSSWSLASTSANTGQIFVTSTVTVSFVKFSFTLKRKPEFLVYSIIVPSNMVVFLSVFVFFLPADSGERLSFSITLVLTQAVYLNLVSNYIPKTSNPVALLSYFMTILLILSTLICLATILTLWCHFKSDGHPPEWLIRILSPGKWRVCGFKNICRERSTKVSDSFENMSSDESEKCKTKPMFKKDNGHDPTWIQTDNQCKDHTPTSIQAVNQGIDHDPITWRDVARKIDKCFFVTFVLSFTIIITFFITIIVSNSEALTTRRSNKDLDFTSSYFKAD